jgi:hypothetical protein
MRILRAAGDAATVAVELADAAASTVLMSDAKQRAGGRDATARRRVGRTRTG